MKFTQELGAAPAALLVRLGRVQRVPAALRVLRFRLAPLLLLPVGHRRITPSLGPYADTFPPNGRLMPAHGCGWPGYC